MSFAVERERFPEPEGAAKAAFDLVVADMDLDGDPDLLVNRHHVAPLELLENRDGHFVRIDGDPPASGLWESPDAPDLFARPQPLRDAIDAAGIPGVYVWHAWDRSGPWHVYVLPDGPTPIHIRSNSRIESVSLEPDRYAAPDPFSIEVEITRPTHFRVQPELVATRLELQTPAALHVGAARRRVEQRPLVLWKEDPHGMAWVDAEESPEPDLYVTRGALQGRLQPPGAPKADRLFAYRGTPARFAHLPDAIPPDYGRGRQVGWVDVDGDGLNELYVANSASPNVLLARRADGRYRDVAPALGIHLVQEDVFTWLDLDADGFDELVAMGPGGFRVGWNQRGRGLGLAPGAPLGLVLPEASGARSFFGSEALHVVDFDSDGRLDLWLTGLGPHHRQVRYRFDGRRFSAIAEPDLPVAPRDLVLLDADDDGFVDALALGPELRLLHNRGADGGFESLPVAETLRLPRNVRGAAADVDGDGRTDAILVGPRGLVLRNRSKNANTRLVVRLDGARPPIGAVVRARYSDGRMLAQRYGSVQNSRFSQGLLPLRFGVPAGTRLEALEVRWPGGGESRVPVEGRPGAVALRRPETSGQR